MQVGQEFVPSVLYMVSIFNKIEYYLQSHQIINLQYLFEQLIMVIVDFVFMARTEFVQFIEFPQSSDWHIKIKCSHCHQDFPKQITMNKNQTVEMPKQHGLAHFAATCKNCERKGFLTIDAKSSFIVRPNQDGIIKQSIAIFQCRGIQIVNVNLGESMSVKIADSPTIIQNADFTDLWCEVDQVTQKLAQVQDAKIQLVTHKEK